MRVHTPHLVVRFHPGSHFNNESPPLLRPRAEDFCPTSVGHFVVHCARACRSAKALKSGSNSRADTREAVTAVDLGLRAFFMRIYIECSVHFPQWLEPETDECGDVYVDCHSMEDVERLVRHFDGCFLKWSFSVCEPDNPRWNRFELIEQYEG